MALPLLWTVFVATLIIIWYLFNKKKSGKRKEFLKERNLKELPGPKGLPVLGNLHQLGVYPNRQFTKWAKEYGDIYQVKIGAFNTVVLSDPQMAKELFGTDYPLTGRLHAPEFTLYPETSGLGMFNSEGERWEVTRRFLLRQLRDFGFGKSSMESLILDDVNQVIDMYKKREGQPVGEIRETLRLSVVNSLWTILSSQRFEYDDPKLLDLANSTSKKFNEIIEKGGLLIFLPWIKDILPEWSGYNMIRKVIDENKHFLEPAVKEHITKLKSGAAPTDFIDVYLNEMGKHKNNPDSMFYGEVAEKHLVQQLFDLFFAGSDTSAMTTAWSILYLAKHQDVQEKLQKEIEEITTGNMRRISVNDRGNMPYALAVIDEILRFSSIVPDGVQHRSLEDIEYRGYWIPKNSYVQPNQAFIHFSERYWEEPGRFWPERFLTAEGKYKRNGNLMPFQVGRRQCLGEALARDSIFLYVTNIFQQFSIKFDPGMEKETSYEPEPGFLMAPFPFTVIMKDRLNGKL